VKAACIVKYVGRLHAATNVMHPSVQGAFIVEYVGEVLDEEEYGRRKDYYASVGQRHYYFMNIGNGEARRHALAVRFTL
jgi:hypothetical protein